MELSTTVFDNINYKINACVDNFPSFFGQNSLDLSDHKAYWSLGTPIAYHKIHTEKRRASSGRDNVRIVSPLLRCKS